jgi:hypothetical protein
MKKKKTVKKEAPKKVVAKKAPAKVKAPKQAKASFQDAISGALDRLLDLAKAQVYDMFKMYVQTNLHVNMPATLEDFIASWSNTLKTHGITDEELVAALAPHQRDYLLASTKKAEGKVVPAQEKLIANRIAEANRLAEVKLCQEPPEAALIGAPVATKPSGVVVQQDQAVKINVDEFGLDLTPPTKAAPAAANSVFADLDVL